MLLMLVMIMDDMLLNSNVINNGSVVCNQNLWSCQVIDQISSYDDAKLKAGSCILKNSMLYCYPTFMIIGMMKCGTGTLMKALNQLHPLIKSGRGPGNINEIHYFTRILHKYTKDSSAKAMSIIASANEYLRFFSSFPLSSVQSSLSLQYPLVFDKSPDYIRSRDALRAIKSMFPDMKHIVIVRNPVLRAISGFHHNCRHRRYIRLGNQDWILNETHSIPAYSVLLKSQWLFYLEIARVSYSPVSYPCTGDDFHQYYLSAENRLNWFNEEEASIGYYDIHIRNLLDLYVLRCHC